MYKRNKAEVVQRKRKGLLSCILLQKGDVRSNTLAITWVDIEPKAAQKPHKHEKEEQVYIIINGQGRMQVGNEFGTVKIGDIIHIPLQTVHAITNTGDHVLTYISASTPAFDLE